MKAIFTTLSLILFSGVLLNLAAQDYETVKSGSWTSTDTWKGGQIPTPNSNSISILINEGHTVAFSDNAANHKQGNNVEMNIEGNLTIKGWGTFSFGNNVEINVSGSLMIPSNNRFKTGNDAKISVAGIFVNSTTTEFGNNTLISIAETGLFENKQSVVAGSNTEILVKGRFVNTNYQIILGSNTEITIEEGAEFVNKTLFQSGDNFSILIEGTFVNSGWKFQVLNDSYVEITTTGSLITTTNLRFGDNLFMTIDGYAKIDGWDFVIGEDSQLVVMGIMEIANQHVFKSESLENSIVACDGNINEPSFAKNITIVDCGTLPVELISFTAVGINKAVELSWTTATEINSDFFLVERSFDGASWEEIAFVTAAGNSNTIVEYSYTDETAKSGIVYYRLKQVDFDGAFEYFAPVAVELSSIGEFNINSVRKAGQNVQIEAGFEQNGHMIIADAMGNILATQTFSADTFTFSFPYDENSGIIVISYSNAISGQGVSSKFLVR